MTNARAAKSAREKAPQMRAEAARAQARRKTTVIAVAVLALVVVIAGVFNFWRADQIRKEASANPPANITDNAFVLGDPSAPHKVLINVDFLCPYCGDFEERYAPALDQAVAEKKIQLAIQPIANLDYLSQGSEYPTRAAMASASVWNQGNAEVWKKFHDLLFANQPEENTTGLTNEQIVELVEQAGADAAAVAADLKEDRFKAWVRTTTEEASRAGRGRTPTVTLDGKILNLGQEADNLAFLDAIGVSTEDTP